MYVDMDCAKISAQPHLRLNASSQCHLTESFGPLEPFGWAGKLSSFSGTFAGGIHRVGMGVLTISTCPVNNKNKKIFTAWKTPVCYISKHKDNCQKLIIHRI